MSPSVHATEDITWSGRDGVRGFEEGTGDRGVRLSEKGTSGVGVGEGQVEVDEREWRVVTGKLKAGRRVHRIGKGKSRAGMGSRKWRVGKGGERVGKWVRSGELVRHLVKRRARTLAELRQECCLNGCRVSDLAAACR